MAANNPHDALFHAVFSRIENAVGELRAVLPASIASRLDWTSLKLLDGHFVDEELSWRESDLVYSVLLQGHRVILYVLFEHQSTSDGWMVLRLLRYMTRIWDRWLADHSNAKSLPVILPVVLAHAEGGWRAPVSMHELFALPEEVLAAVAPHVPQFRFVLDDLAERSDAELRARALQALGILALLLMRHAREKQDLLHYVREWADLFRQVWQAPNGREALGMLVRYVVLVSERTKIQDLARTLVPVLGDAAGEVVMTEGERLIQLGEARGEARGRAEGEARGRAQGRSAALLAVFSARALPISPELRERIAACTDIALLDKWIARAATSASAAEALSEA